VNWGSTVVELLVTLHHPVDFASCPIDVIYITEGQQKVVFNEKMRLQGARGHGRCMSPSGTA
jgi:hypothetical protein